MMSPRRDEACANTARTNRTCRSSASLLTVRPRSTAIATERPDLLFLDIQMDTMTGIELARALDVATLPLIVFVTAYDNYAIQAFEVNAIDYSAQALRSGTV